MAAETEVVVVAQLRARPMRYVDFADRVERFGSGNPSFRPIARVIDSGGQQAVITYALRGRALAEVDADFDEMLDQVKAKRLQGLVLVASEKE